MGQALGYGLSFGLGTVVYCMGAGSVYGKDLINERMNHFHPDQHVAELR